MDYIDREVGQFPISIGTSLALEGLFGIHPNQPKFPSGHRRINLLWVNLRTMVRNFYASMTTENARKAPMDASLQVMIQELEFLQSLPQQAIKRQLQVVVYYNDLEDLRWRFPNAKYKEPKTERQIYFHHMENLLLKNILDYIATQDQLQILKVSKSPPANPGVVALLTHHPHELLWRFQFESMFLLESHTGKLKSYGQWFTKLKGVKPEDHIPFNPITLQLYGDSDVFEPQERKIREEVKQLAHTRKWTTVTTMEKIKDDIRNYGGEKLKKLMTSLLR